MVDRGSTSTRSISDMVLSLLQSYAQQNQVTLRHRIRPYGKLERCVTSIRHRQTFHHLLYLQFLRRRIHPNPPNSLLRQKNKAHLAAMCNDAYSETIILRHRPSSRSMKRRRTQHSVTQITKSKLKILRQLTYSPISPTHPQYPPSQTRPPPYNPTPS